MTPIILKSDYNSVKVYLKETDEVVEFYKMELLSSDEDEYNFRMQGQISDSSRCNSWKYKAKAVFNHLEELQFIINIKLLD